MSVAAFIGREVREAIPPTLLFLFVFHMIALTQAAARGEFGIGALRATTATLGALVIAKAILVVEALPIARRFAGRRTRRILWKTLLFGVMALLFRFLEELIHLAAKPGGLAPALQSTLHEISWPLFWVLALWTLGALLLYSLLSELARAVGPEKAREALLGEDEEGRTL
jgi:hypothetical protein